MNFTCIVVETACTTKTVDIEKLWEKSGGNFLNVDDQISKVAIGLYEPEDVELIAIKSWTKCRVSAAAKKVA